MNIGPGETSPMMDFANRSAGMSVYGPMTCGIGAPGVTAPSVTNSKHVSEKRSCEHFEGSDPATRPTPKDY